MAKIKFRTAYDAEHYRVPAPVSDDGMTRQEFREECDVNALMARYDKAGAMPGPVNSMAPEYFDCTELPTDFREAMNFMIEAENAFMRLPAIARRDLGNDPANFVEFASDPKNLDKMREWGLAPAAPVPPEPSLVRVVADVEPAPSAPPARS